MTPSERGRLEGRAAVDTAAKATRMRSARKPADKFWRKVTTRRHGRASARVQVSWTTVAAAAYKVCPNPMNLSSFPRKSRFFVALALVMVAAVAGLRGATPGHLDPITLSTGWQLQDVAK